MKPVRGRRLRLRDHVFAAAEADLELNVVDRDRKQRAELGGQRGG